MNNIILSALFINRMNVCTLVGWKEIGHDYDIIVLTGDTTYCMFN